MRPSDRYLPWGRSAPVAAVTRAALCCGFPPACCLAIARPWLAVHSQCKRHCEEAARGCASSHEWTRGGVSTLVGWAALSVCFCSQDPLMCCESSGSAPLHCSQRMVINFFVLVTQACDVFLSCLRWGYVQKKKAPTDVCFRADQLFFNPVFISVIQKRGFRGSSASYPFGLD